LFPDLRQWILDLPTGALLSCTCSQPLLAIPNFSLLLSSPTHVAVLFLCLFSS
jgi:hypothetical protein